MAIAVLSEMAIPAHIAPMPLAQRVTRAIAATFLAAAVGLLVGRVDFLLLLGSLVLGNAAGASVVLAVVSGLIATLLCWRSMRRDSARAAAPLALFAFFSLGFAAYAWSLQSRGLVVSAFRFTSDGDALAGTVIRPRGDRSYPGIVIAQGSLNVPHRAYASLAAALARAGFVVLNFDRRGIGRSAGGDKLDPRNNASPAYLEQLGRDLASASRALRAARFVLPQRVGYYGISQGGWVIPLAAREDAEAAFALIVSGPTTSTREEGVYSELTGEDDDHFGRRPPRISFDEANAKLNHTTAGGFDPRPILGELHIPIQWMLGAWDNSIPVAATVRIIDSLALTGKPFRVMTIPEANHGLMIARGPRAGVTPYWEPAVWDTTLTLLRQLSRE